jgi:hypothetical protein
MKASQDAHPFEINELYRCPVMRKAAEFRTLLLQEETQSGFSRGAQRSTVTNDDHTTSYGGLSRRCSGPG